MISRNILFLFTSIIISSIISYYYNQKINNKFIIYFFTLSIILYILFSFLGYKENIYYENFENDVEPEEEDGEGEDTNLNWLHILLLLLFIFIILILQFFEDIFKAINEIEANIILLNMFKKIDNKLNDKSLNTKILTVIPGSTFVDVKDAIKNSISVLNNPSSDNITKYNDSIDKLKNNISNNKLLNDKINELNPELLPNITDMIDNTSGYINHDIDLDKYKNLLKSSPLINNLIDSLNKPGNNKDFNKINKIKKIFNNAFFFC